MRISRSQLPRRGDEGPSLDKPYLLFRHWPDDVGIAYQRRQNFAWLNARPSCAAARRDLLKIGVEITNLGVVASEFCSIRYEYTLCCGYCSHNSGDRSSYDQAHCFDSKCGVQLSSGSINLGFLAARGGKSRLDIPAAFPNWIDNDDQSVFPFCRFRARVETPWDQHLDPADWHHDDRRLLVGDIYVGFDEWYRS